MRRCSHFAAIVFLVASAARAQTVVTRVNHSELVSVFNAQMAKATLHEQGRFGVADFTLLNPLPGSICTFTELELRADDSKASLAEEKSLSATLSTADLCDCVAQVGCTDAASCAQAWLGGACPIAPVFSDVKIGDLFAQVIETINTTVGDVDGTHVRYSADQKYSVCGGFDVQFAESIEVTSSVGSPPQTTTDLETFATEFLCGVGNGFEQVPNGSVTVYTSTRQCLGHDTEISFAPGGGIFFLRAHVPLIDQRTSDQYVCAADGHALDFDLQWSGNSQPVTNVLHDLGFGPQQGPVMLRTTTVVNQGADVSGTIKLDGVDILPSNPLSAANVATGLFSLVVSLHQL
jgi:hypothetical protein